MLRFAFVSIFPELIQTVAGHSILGRACRRGLVEMQAIDPRRWAGGRHRAVDDRPYGGGPGMVLAAPPIAGAIDHLRAEDPACRLLLPSPQGRRVEHRWIRSLADSGQTLVFLCGHYEGIDERIAQLYAPEEFSLGDFVVSGGELPSLLVADAVARLLPGVLGDAASAVEDSFGAGADGLLDHGCWTRPPVFRGLAVPEVLQGGDHAAIAAWRAAQRRRRTAQRRPELLDEH
jgi:tRNA (guanine37-N1)-methyltransferase